MIALISCVAGHPCSLSFHTKESRLLQTYIKTEINRSIRKRVPPLACSKPYSAYFSTRSGRGFRFFVPFCSLHPTIVPRSQENTAPRIEQREWKLILNGGCTSSNEKKLENLCSSVTCFRCGDYRLVSISLSKTTFFL